jgi:cysteine desulfuration protein SufE
MEDNIFFQSCMAKQQKIKEIFAHCSTPQMKYEKIIDLGRSLPPFPTALKTADRLVKGCQSQMYLATSFEEGKVQFQAQTDALISAGLAALLLAAYSDEPPVAILSCPPDFLEELGIHGSLSPSRSNGLSSLFLRMKQEALNFLVATPV